MNPLYAAYGSNLHLGQMAHRCPGAQTVETAVLENYQLLFRGGDGHGVATVEPMAGSSVPILLWTITGRNEQALDHYEGWPHLYGKETLTFSGEDGPVSAMLYRMTPGHPAGRPSDFYYNILEESYRACGFPVSGLELALERTLEAMAQERCQGMLPPW
ncbi:gamma-glutamylcyclotransferase family protein [uncultured Intestinimonas sp.]|uniref:gamma-glutamylcyclotransferase family protein n=1 Tax=uncultured Intestinimonas sp. TaxID=1689265 RepID=UPI0026003BC4|nr:gamma-glutamylcyclotransferase family protein [uncultured Intestinimonas sp.]